MFIVLLLLYILFLLNNIGQAIWVFTISSGSQEVRQAAITEWMSIVIIIICALQLIATGALLGFHCYISCCLDLTTIAFYQSDTDSKKSSHVSNKVTSEALDVIDVGEVNQSPIHFVGTRDMAPNSSVELR